MDGKEKTGIGGVRLETLAQAQHVIVHGAAEGSIVVAPNLIEQLVAGENVPRRGRQNFRSLNSRTVSATAVPPWVASMLVKSTRASPKVRISWALVCCVMGALCGPLRRIARRTRARSSLGLKGLVT